MALEDEIKKLTAAIEAQNKFMASLPKGAGAAAAAGKPAEATPAKMTVEGMAAKFAAYLAEAADDDDERTKRGTRVKAMLKHFGAKKVGELSLGKVKEAMGYLKMMENDQDPSYGGDDNGDNESLV